jgi:bifunctional DNA-binding transcriptional regulator/antitoxin component of YhaV-PrlF toxin-antitoxin module
MILAFLSASIGLVAVFLLRLDRGPAMSGTRLDVLLGYGGLIAATVLATRSSISATPSRSRSQIAVAVFDLSALAETRLEPAPPDRRYSLLMPREVRKRRRGTTRISTKHQVTLPADALRAAGLQVGEVLEVAAAANGEVALRRAENPYRLFAGTLTGVFPPGYLERLRQEWR